MTEITYSMAEVAELTEFPGGRNKLLEWMRMNNFLNEQNQPDSRLNNRGWFKVFDKRINKYGFLAIYGVPTLTSSGLSAFDKLIRIYFVDKDMERFNDLLKQILPEKFNELLNQSGSDAKTEPQTQIN